MDNNKTKSQQLAETRGREQLNEMAELKLGLFSLECSKTVVVLRLILHNI